MRRTFRVILYSTLSLFLLLNPCICEGQDYFALLIGIGEYPENSGWNRIHGDNDIPIVKRKLIQQGFKENNINSLTNNEATKSNILAAFKDLVLKAKKDDVIYIHFSGHGQQVTDLNGDEPDGLDEAWIPYDACKVFIEGIYEGENHLIDDEINELLTRLREKVGAGGKIIILADACHSGSGSRGNHDGEDDIFIRGTGDIFSIPSWKKQPARKQESVEWLYVAACKSYQTNYEYKAPNGNFYGALSYTLYKEEKDLFSNSYEDILRSWSDQISKIARFPQNIDNDGQPNRRNKYMF